jgi:hypothetical protein
MAELRVGALPETSTKRWHVQPENLDERFLVTPTLAIEVAVGESD